jgi:hypothetical protein
VVLAAGMLGAVVESAMVESRLVAAVEAIRDASNPMALLCVSAMLLIDVNVMSDVGRW